MLKSPEKKSRKNVKEPRKDKKLKIKIKNEMPRRPTSRKRAEAHGEKPFVAVSC